MNRPQTQTSESIAELCSPPTALRFAFKLYVFAATCGVCGLIGCNRDTNSLPPSGNLPSAAALQTKVVAQGQILPAGGLIRLAATPGDVIDQIHVKVGDAVEAGQTLATMRSLKLQEARFDALQSRQRDAQHQQSSAIQQAQLQLTTAEAKVQQAVAQQESLERQAKLLELAKEQVAASEKALDRVESIAKDPLTSSFVGAMQVDQQRLAHGEAQLKYEQQAENYEQAKEAAQLNALASDQQLQAAKLAMRIAEQSLSVKAIESELKALEIQTVSATIKAPQAAVVVAVNSRAGETAAQFPVVELADVTQTICEVEVVEVDAGRVQKGQVAIISSPALPKELRGKVARISRLVGRPQLAVADPLAKADYRSLNVIIEIDPTDIPIASQWLQLQVKVEITILEDATQSNASASAPDALP